MVATYLPFGKLLRLQDAAIPNSPYGAAKVLSLPKEIVCGVEEVEGAREAVLQWQLSLWAERLDAPSSQRTNSTHQHRSVTFPPVMCSCLARRCCGITPLCTSCPAL